MLAAKTALTIRYDALGEDTSAEMGAENRLKVETRLRHLEERGVSTQIAAWSWLSWKTSLLYLFSLWPGFLIHCIFGVIVTVAYLPTLSGGPVSWCQLFLFVWLSLCTLYWRILALKKWKWWCTYILLHLLIVNISWLCRGFSLEGSQFVYYSSFTPFLIVISQNLMVFRVESFLRSQS